MGSRASAVPSDPLDALTFRVSPTNDMKVAKVVGNNVLLSKGGIFPAKGIETPIMVIGASASKALSISDKKAFAEARLQKIATLKDVRPTSTAPITIDGLDGFESVGDAADVDTGTAAVVYQVVLFDANGYYGIQGIASKQQGETQLQTFQQIARTFRASRAQH
jgi:hypothetical protein